MFDNYEPDVGADEFITIPDGRRVTLYHKGTVTLNDNTQLKGVLHVPDFQYNLLLMNNLINKCYVQGHLMKKP